MNHNLSNREQANVVKVKSGKIACYGVSDLNLLISSFFFESLSRSMSIERLSQEEDPKENAKEARAWSYQQKFSDLRNFQKKSENFKRTIFVRKVRKIS
jgi:hypothetical protein